MLAVLYGDAWFEGSPLASEPASRVGHACAIGGDPLTLVTPAGRGLPRTLFVHGGEDSVGNFLTDLWSLSLPTRIETSGATNGITTTFLTLTLSLTLTLTLTLTLIGPQMA